MSEWRYQYLCVWWIYTVVFSHPSPCHSNQWGSRGDRVFPCHPMSHSRIDWEWQAGAPVVMLQSGERSALCWLINGSGHYHEINGFWSSLWPPTLHRARPGQARTCRRRALYDLEGRSSRRVLNTCRRALITSWVASVIIFTADPLDCWQASGW